MKTRYAIFAAGAIAVLMLFAYLNFSGVLADSGPVARGFVAVAPIAGLIVTITVIAMLRSSRENGGTSGVDWDSQPMAVAVVKELRYANATTSEGELHDVSVDVLTTDGREFPGVVRMGLDGFEARKLVPGTLIPVHHFAGDPERLAPIARARRGSDDVVATLRAVRRAFGFESAVDARLPAEGMPARATVTSVRRTGDVRHHHVPLRIDATILRADGTELPVSGETWAEEVTAEQLGPGAILNVRVDPRDERIVGFQA